MAFKRLYIFKSIWMLPPKILALFRLSSWTRFSSASSFFLWKYNVIPIYFLFCGTYYVRVLYIYLKAFICCRQKSWPCFVLVVGPGLVRPQAFSRQNTTWYQLLFWFCGTYVAFIYISKHVFLNLTAKNGSGFSCRNTTWYQVLTFATTVQPFIILLIIFQTTTVHFEFGENRRQFPFP